MILEIKETAGMPMNQNSSLRLTALTADALLQVPPAADARQIAAVSGDRQVLWDQEAARVLLVPGAVRGR